MGEFKEGQPDGKGYDMHTYECTYACTHACTCTYVCIYMRKCMFMGICIYIYIYIVCIHTYICISHRIEMHANGGVYEGEFRQGMRHGVGCMYGRPGLEVRMRVRVCVCVRVCLAACSCINVCMHE